MMELKVRPTIVSYNNFQQFAEIENKKNACYITNIKKKWRQRDESVLF